MNILTQEARKRQAVVKLANRKFLRRCRQRNTEVQMRSSMNSIALARLPCVNMINDAIAGVLLKAVERVGKT